MDEPTPTRVADTGAAHSGDVDPEAVGPPAAAPGSYRRWNYAGAIAGGVAALLIVTLGVAVPLQVIPPKKDEAVAMVMPLMPPQRPPEFGLASWYGDHEAGQPTASGAAFRPDALTAAHRWLPLGTKVRVTRLGTKRSTVVTINDRGPYVGGRLIDLSPAAARQLAMVKKGLARVRVDVLEVPHAATETVAKHVKKPAKKRPRELVEIPAPTPAVEPAAPEEPAEAAPVAPPPTKTVAEKPAAAVAPAAPAAPAGPDSNTHFP